MKTKFLLTLIVLGTYSLSFAQDNSSVISKSQSFIGVTGGYANALGNFTKSNYDDPKSGYANSSGMNIGIEGAYFFHRNIGIGGIISNTTFNVRGKQALADGYKEAFDVDYTTVSENGNYSTLNFLIGPYFSFPIKKFTFDVRVIGGLTHAKTPQFRVDIEDQSDATFYQNSSTANTFGFQGGAGIRYSILKNLSIKLNADFFYSKPNFNITNVNRADNAGRLITSYNQPITGFYLNFGLAYQFN